MQLTTSLGSRENILGLVYLAVALGLLGNAIYFAQVNAQLLNASEQLETIVQAARLDLRNGNDKAYVTAILHNPSDIGGLSLLTISYQVFVNSTQNDFNYQGSSVIGTTSKNIQGQIAAGSSLNISSPVTITPDVVPSLTLFVQQNNSTLLIFVGVILQIQSSYIASVGIASCTELPMKTLTICPGLRPAVGGGGGGA